MVDTGFEKLPNNDDLFKLSSGVGHHWRPGYYFPDSTFHVCVLIFLMSFKLMFSFIMTYKKT